MKNFIETISLKRSLQLETESVNKKLKLSSHIKSSLTIEKTQERREKRRRKRVYTCPDDTLTEEKFKRDLENDSLFIHSSSPKKEDGKDSLNHSRDSLSESKKNISSESNDIENLENVESLQDITDSGFNLSSLFREGGKSHNNAFSTFTSLDSTILFTNECKTVSELVTYFDEKNENND